MKAHKTPKKFLNILLCAVMTGCACSGLHAQVTAGIDATRTSGVAPLAVYFDASGTTASGTSYPMHELYFEWNFGDSGAGNWTTSGLSKNIATGPAVAHVFETPGTYEVTLYVGDQSGSSDVEVVTITVSDPDTVYAGSNTICFSTNGDFSGAPSGAQQVTTSSLSTVLSYQGTNKRLLLKRGQTFTSTSKNSLTAVGPCMLGAYGSESVLPRIASSGNGAIVSYQGPDWRIMDIEFEGNRQSNGVVAEARETTDILMFRTTVVPRTFHGGFYISGSALDLLGEDIPQGVFFVENNWQDFGFGAGACIMFFSAGRFAILGNHLEDISQGEHIIRIEHGEKGVISSNYFGEQADKKLLLTVRNRNQSESCSAGCGRDTKEIFITDNTFVNHSDWSLALVDMNKSTHTVNGHDFIIERNFFKSGLSGKGQKAVTFKRGDNVTVRNNVILMNEWAYANGIEIDGETDNAWVNNNTAYTADNSTSLVWCVDMRPGTGINRFAENNLLYAPNANSSSVMKGTSGATVNNNINANTNPFITATIDGPEDFELNSSSAAKDAGTAVAVFVDYKLNPRPAGTTWDVGAYEYGSVVVVVPVTGVSLSSESLSLQVSESDQLTATVSPANASNKAVVWSSDNTDVATVDSTGHVMAVGEGTATITVTTTDGSFSADCVVTVTEINASSPLFAEIIGATLLDEENSRYESSWFGLFVEREEWGGWIQHESMGWYYPAEDTSSEDIWIWSAAFESWLYTSETFFPWLWCDAEVLWPEQSGYAWLYFHATATQDPWYYHTGTGKWKSEQ